MDRLYWWPPTTPPDCPRPPDALVEAARRDVPVVLTDRELNHPADEIGVGWNELVEALRAKGHGRTAATWGMYALVCEGLLRLREFACRPDATANRFGSDNYRLDVLRDSADPARSQPVPAGSFPLLVVTETDGLWDWWQAPPEPAHSTQRPRRRKRRSLAIPQLTPKQLEACQTVAECNGDIAEAARRLGRDRKTIKQHLDAAQNKLGKSAVKHATQSLPNDRRGQANLSAEDDRRQ
jgi:DNA-binding CsgD family transcriptional regulator